jgi:hypothetical protein
MLYDIYKLDTGSNTKHESKDDSSRDDSRRDDSRRAAHSNDVRNPYRDPRGEPWKRVRNVSFQKDRPKTWTKPHNREVSNIHSEQIDSQVDTEDDEYWHRYDSQGYDSEPEDYSWRRDLEANKSPLDIQKIIETTVSAMMGANRAA